MLYWNTEAFRFLASGHQHCFPALPSQIMRLELGLLVLRSFVRQFREHFDTLYWNIEEFNDMFADLIQDLASLNINVTEDEMNRFLNADK